MHLLPQIYGPVVVLLPVYTRGFLHLGSVLRATRQNLGWLLRE